MRLLRESLDALVSDRVTPGYAAYVRVDGEVTELFGGGLTDAPDAPGPDRTEDYLAQSLKPVIPWIEGRSRALGWWASDDGGLVRHDGFTGTTICLAPETGNLGVLLTNAVYFGRRNPRIGEVRALLADFVTEQDARE